MGNNPSWFSGDNKPVEEVTWYDAVAFCEAVGGFLPTEAQWEFAARGGNNSNGYIYSGSDNLDEVGWYWGNSSSGIKDVGQKKANELGIYDMSGNVWEWTADWYQSSYPSGSMNPTGASSGSPRVVRGGSWISGGDDCRVSNRVSSRPGYDYSILGFRVAFPRN
jgi:formylglycine-generating enzyme required for sulfatase activity